MLLGRLLSIDGHLSNHRRCAKQQYPQRRRYHAPFSIVLLSLLPIQLLCRAAVFLDSVQRRNRVCLFGYERLDRVWTWHTLSCEDHCQMGSTRRNCFSCFNYCSTVFLPSYRFHINPVFPADIWDFVLCLMWTVEGQFHGATTYILLAFSTYLVFVGGKCWHAS